MGRTIAVGLAHDPKMGATDLILLPGEETPPLRPGLRVFIPETLADALMGLRMAYAEHADIATLGSAKVVGTHEWTAAIETRLIEFLEDLGNCVMDSWEGVRNGIRNGARIASGSTSRELAGAFRGKPAICIGAGPSASPDVMKRIAALADSHYIFSCDAMTHACRDAGFVPHFVTMLERVPEMLPLVEGADPSSTLLAMPVVDPACVARFTRVCWFWGGDDLYKWLDPSIPLATCGRSSGTLAVAAAALAGCSPIYLVGHDLAYGPDRAGHTPVAHREAVDGQVKKDANAGGGLYETTYTTVPGYNGSQVYTNGAWNLMRGDIESMVALYPAQVFLSAQNGMGARLAKVPSVPLPEPSPWTCPVPAVLPPSTVPDPRARLDSIRADCARLVEHAKATLDALGPEGANLNNLAAELAINRIVSPENSALFCYALRTVIHTMTLRMHLWDGICPVPRQLQRDCLAVLATSMLGVAHHLEEDFPCLPTP
jgi:hypothetical protein